MRHEVRRQAEAVAEGCPDSAGLESSEAFSAAAPAWRPLVGAQTPDYLLQHYRWAYLRPGGVWLFDHQPIINAILFGQYRRIMDATLRLLEPESAGSTLQIAGVYGELTPTLAERIDDLHMIDIAPIQLDLAARKLAAAGHRAGLAQMDAESLDFGEGRFDTTLMFLLLHEMPPQARERTLAEAVRVTRRGGSLVIAEYGEITRSHPLHRIPMLRWVLTRAEPFLDGFWCEDLSARVAEAGAECGKEATLEEGVAIFGGFYRVVRYRVE